MLDVLTARVTDIVTRKVTLVGLTDIMFDRYPGDNDTKLEPHQKFYLEPGASRVIGLPSLNIMSFLSAPQHQFRSETPTRQTQVQRHRKRDA
jgi:hypothetical protein